MSSYLEEVSLAILKTLGVEADHLDTVPVREEFRGKIIWDGEVEVFNLIGHPEAARCYAWGHDEEGQLKTTVVIQVPPVVSAQTAVKAAIAKKCLIAEIDDLANWIW
jgi:hypothetical protein